MKYLSLIITLLCCISCQESILENNEEENTVTELRCAIECSDYSFTIEKYEQHSCCYTKITVSNYCGIIIKSDKNSPGQIEYQSQIVPFEIIDHATSVFLFPLCKEEGSYNVYLLASEAQPEEYCEKIQITGCEQSCCDELELGLLSIENQNGCCVYNLEVENNSICDVTFGTTNQNVPLGTSSYQLSPCFSSTDQAFVIANGVVCKSLDLNETCTSCCDDGTVEIGFGGGEMTTDGCCLYKPRLTNNSSCNLVVRLGDVMITLQPGESKHQFFKVCPPNTDLNTGILYFFESVTLQIMNAEGEVCLQEIFNLNCGQG